MDDLHERLTRHGPPQGPCNRTGELGRSSSEARARLRRELEGLVERRAWGKGRSRVRESRRGERVEEVLCGTEVDTPVGTCYEIKGVYRGEYRHGAYRMDAFLDADMAVLNLFCGGHGGPRGMRPEDVAFLDVETTSLSLGTGTYVFLLGLGYLREGRFHLHQLFLRDFREERALLYRARQLLARFECLVTFNGKRFDLPLLEARYAMNLEEESFGDRRSWDLLYPARRLWHDRLGDCRLQTIERQRLGVTREEADVPGDQIPEIYLRYVHAGDPAGLDRVAYHNAMDVLTMAVLAVHIERCLTRKDPADGDLLSAGRYYERKGAPEWGRDCYEAVSCKGLTEADKDMARLRLAMQMKRAGRIEAALPIWKELIDRGGLGFEQSCLEIAKYLEHRVHRFDEAIRVVRHALAQDRVLAERIRTDLEKRLERLLRKKEKAWRR